MYDEKINQFVPANDWYPRLPKWPVISFCEDVQAGKFYIGTDSGLVVFNTHTNKLSYQGRNVDNEPLIEKWGQIPNVAPMLLDSKHRLWFLTWPPTVGAPSFFCYDLRNNSTILKNYSFFPW